MPIIEVVYAGVLDGHNDAIYALASGPSPNIVFSAGGDGMVVKWDLDKKGEGELVAQLPSAIYSLLYLKETNILVAGCRFGSLYVLDLTTHNQKQLIELKGDVFGLCRIDGQSSFAAACAGGYLYFISDNNFEIVKEIHPTTSHCRTLALMPDGKKLASGWSDGKIRIYDTSTFIEEESFMAHSPSVFSMVYGNNGNHLISGGRDAQIKIWDARFSYLEERKIPAHLFTINNIIQIQEFGLMASASRDKTIKLWNAKTFDLLKVIDRTKLPAHSHSVNKLHWTGYKDYLLSAGDDKIIRIWGIICG